MDNQDRREQLEEQDQLEAATPPHDHEWAAAIEKPELDESFWI